MMAEDYASLAADWHLEWMPPKTLEAGLEARADIAARLAERLGFGRVDQDAPFRRRPPWRETRPGGGAAGCRRLRGIAAAWECGRHRAPSPDISVRRGKARFPSGFKSHPTIVAFG